MGYDMHFHDQDDYAEPGYFRLNAWGMRWCLGEMAARHMIFDAGRPPEFPDVADWEPMTDADRRALDEVLSWHGPEVPGIPAHKFGTNDGWIVTPAECEAALQLAEKWPPPAENPEVWKRWLDYLSRAREHQGFEVH